MNGVKILKRPQDLLKLPPVAIPSYNRPESICSKTLAYLKYIEYPESLITIFVADEEQKELYSTIPTSLYGSLVVAKKGLANARNFISNYYPEGTWIIQMDDDINTIMDRYKLGWGFVEWIPKAILRAESENIELIGILPNDDTRNMDDVWTTHLTHILGSFFMLKIRRSLIITMNHKEDYERSILSYNYCGKVLRYKGFGVSTKYNSGVMGTGLLSEDRPAEMAKEVYELASKYPRHVKAVLKKGLPDIALNWRYKDSWITPSFLDAIRNESQCIEAGNIQPLHS